MENLESLLVLESSRRNTDMVADLVLQKTELVGEIITILLKNEHPVSWKAAWVADAVSEKRPDLLLPYLDKLILNLELLSSDGVKREVLRMFCRYSFNEEQMGPLISLCFNWLLSTSEPVAVKRFSMEILYKMSNHEAGIKKELADSIEMRMFEESAGFRSYGKKLLKQLYMEMRGSK